MRQIIIINKKTLWWAFSAILYHTTFIGNFREFSPHFFASSSLFSIPTPQIDHDVVRSKQRVNGTVYCVIEYISKTIVSYLITYPERISTFDLLGAKSKE